MSKFRFSVKWLMFALVLVLSVSSTAAQALDKMTLWNSGTTVLRGADIFQRIRYPALDGPDFLGSGYIGPPYTQADFDQLAAMGANYVNLSVPGIYTIEPPYQLDTGARDNLDNLLTMAANAHLYAVISFRTGPGRSDFTFYRDGAGVWFPPQYLIETVWTDQLAQDAWVDMWHDTAVRYQNNPIVVGYDLMVEPNSIVLLDGVYTPQDFHDGGYEGTLYDWNPLELRLINKIREVDTDTPILLSNNGWNGLGWLSSTYISTDPRVVYTTHNYEPFAYSNQEYSAHMNTYPGVFDANYDNIPDTVNRAWLENWYASTLDPFLAAHDVPFAVNEMGVTRWSPGADAYLRDEYSIVEARGLNHAIWMYHANWQPFKNGDNSFDFTLGPNPSNTHNVSSSALLTTIKQNWAQNGIPKQNYFTASPATLTWNPVNSATAYWIQVADNPDFTNPIYSKNDVSIDTLHYDAVLDNGTYYWHVRARQSDGVNWGDWSVTERFAVNAP